MCGNSEVSFAVSSRGRLQPWQPSLERIEAGTLLIIVQMMLLIEEII